MSGLASTLWIYEFNVHSGWATVFRSMSVETIHGRMRKKHEAMFEAEHWKYRKLAAIGGTLYEPTKCL